MKKIWFALFAMLIVGFWACPSMAEQRTYYGYPVLKEGQKGMQWVLEQDGLETAKLGTFPNNQRVQNCLKESFELEKMVRFSGNWQKKEYSTELDPGTAQCAQIVRKGDCPEKILRTVTINATYMGMDCGDFCHLFLLPEYGDEFSMYADEEEIEKLFGTEPGKKVQVTYKVVMEWLPDNLENPQDDYGICTISPSFISGKVLGQKLMSR